MSLERSELCALVREGLEVMQMTGRASMVRELPLTQGLVRADHFAANPYLWPYDLSGYGSISCRANESASELRAMCFTPH